MTLTPQLRIIGTVLSELKPGDAIPKNYDESQQTGVLAIDPALSEGLAGICQGQTIVVLFWLDQAERHVLQVYPRGDRSQGLRGVFSTRSPARPNPIGLSELKVLAVNGTRLTVCGLDVYDGTPIIDIKKQITPKAETSSARD